MSKKVLIAEDEESILVSLEFLMRSDGYLVRAIRQGDQVLLSVGDFQPDLVLLDVMLPRCNGFDLCKQMRANTEWTGMKIIIISAKGRASEVQRGLDSGADAYVTKPFATSELRALVGQLIQ